MLFRSRQQGPALVNQSDDPMLRPFRWRSIGPVGQGGRVDDIAVHPTDTRVFYVGFATGGLWKTTNNGTTFEPIFDEYETHSIGALAIAPSNPDVLYVGTGEANNRQSSSFGAGVYSLFGIPKAGSSTSACQGVASRRGCYRVIDVMGS